MKRILQLSILFATLFCLLGFSSDTKVITIHMIGDSTMADKPLEKQNPERGWGQYLPSLFDDGVAVKNHAQNGRSTKSFITRGLWDKVEKELRAGDYLFIQFGHNDQKESDPERFAAPWGEYSDNLRLFVKTAQQKGAIPVLLTPIARRHFDKEGNLKNVHEDYPVAMREVAKVTGALLIDMTELTNRWLTELGDSLSRPYFMQIEPGINPLYPDGKNDNTHLVSRGASKVARIATAQIANQIPQLAEHLRECDFVVAQDGSGDFFTVQEAIDAVPDYGKNRPTTILVRRGVYKEKVIIAPSKNSVHLIGEEAEKTVITYDNYASKIGSTGFELGTSGTASVYVFGSDFTAQDITFENSAGPVGQAVAIAVGGDRISFFRCRFIGNQDTLYTFERGSRQYYQDCYIEGTTDFIFGFSTAFFKNCHIHSKRNSFVTAASTPQEQKYGYVFEDCRLTADRGITKCHLGRPWRPYAKTVFINCYMGSHILPAGWHNWGKPENEKTAYYAEYKSYGEGGSADGRVKWSHRLKPSMLKDYRIEQVLGGDDGWNPVEVE